MGLIVEVANENTLFFADRNTIKRVLHRIRLHLNNGTRTRRAYVEDSQIILSMSVVTRLRSALRAEKLDISLACVDRHEKTRLFIQRQERTRIS